MGVAALFLYMFLSATLVWNANTEEDLAGYQVCLEEKWCLDVGNVNIYILDWTPAYSYLTVKAYDTSGNISEPSEEIQHEGYECRTDMNEDGKINMHDLRIFKEEWGRWDCR